MKASRAAAAMAILGTYGAVFRMRFASGCEVKVVDNHFRYVRVKHFGRIGRTAKEVPKVDAHFHIGWHALVIIWLTGIQGVLSGVSEPLTIKTSVGVPFDFGRHPVEAVDSWSLLK